jgi:hypothetical protein
MLYIAENYWKSIVSDYEKGEFSPINYALELYWQSLAADARALAQRF